METPVNHNNKRKADSPSQPGSSTEYILPLTTPKRNRPSRPPQIVRHNLNYLHTNADPPLPAEYERSRDDDDDDDNSDSDDDNRPLYDDDDDEKSKSEVSDVFTKAASTRRVKRRHTDEAQESDNEEEEVDPIQSGEEITMEIDTDRTISATERRRISWDFVDNEGEGIIGNSEGSVCATISRAFHTIEQLKAINRPSEYEADEIVNLLRKWKGYWYIDRIDEDAHNQLMYRLGDRDDPRGTNQDTALKNVLAVHQKLSSLLRYHGLYDIHTESYKRWMDVIERKINAAAIFRRGKVNLMMGGDDVEIPGTAGSSAALQEMFAPAGSKPKSHQHLLNFLKARFNDLKYVRSGRQVYHEIVYNGYKTKAYEELYDLDDKTDKTGMDEFVYRSASQTSCPEMYFHRTDVLGFHSPIVKELVSCSELSDLRRTRGLYSFANGRYDARTDTFYPYNKSGEIEPPEIAAQHSIHFIPVDLKDTGAVGPDCIAVPHKTVRGALVYKNADGVVLWDDVTKTGTNPCYEIDDPLRPGERKKVYPYDPMNESTVARRRPLRKARDIKTPTVTKLMLGQWNRTNLGNEACQVHKWLFASLGRLAFQLGSKNGGDDKQFVPMLFGLAGTGKSTLIKAIVKQFPREDVFHMESSGESTFQLQGAIGKKMWCIQELKKDLRLSSSRFQNMVSGEHMPIPRKNRDEVSQEWTLPGIMAGNDRVPFPDAQGSISRRILSFEHTQKVSTVDTTLEVQIEAELPDFIRKCIMIYRTEMMRVGSRDIWAANVLPKYFHKTRANLKKHVDFSMAFIEDDKHCVQCDKKDTPAEKDEYVAPLEAIVDAIRLTLPMERKADVNHDTLKVTLEQSSYEVFHLSGSQKNGVVQPKDKKSNSRTGTDERQMDVPATLAFRSTPRIAEEVKEEDKMTEEFPLVELPEPLAEDELNLDDGDDEHAGFDRDDDDVLIASLSKNYVMKTVDSEGSQLKPIKCVLWQGAELTKGWFVRGVTLVAQKGQCRIIREE
jgi:uncharacterized protein DUF5906